jgi:hypothetical protein
MEEFSRFFESQKPNSSPPPHGGLLSLPSLAFSKSFHVVRHFSSSGRLPSIHSFEYASLLVSDYLSA